LSSFQRWREVAVQYDGLNDVDVLAPTQDPRDDFLQRGKLDGEEIALRDGHGGDWSEWPEDLRVREVPEAFKLLR